MFRNIDIISFEKLLLLNNFGKKEFVLIGQISELQKKKNIIQLFHCMKRKKFFTFVYKPTHFVDKRSQIWLYFKFSALISSKF